MWDQLKRQPGWVALMDHLEKKQGTKGAKILNRQTKDYAEYSYECGFFKGLQYVMNYVEKSCAEERNSS